MPKAARPRDSQAAQALPPDSERLRLDQRGSPTATPARDAGSSPTPLDAPYLTEHHIGRNRCIECEAPVTARGLCKKHYQRWRRNGTQEVQRLLGAGLIERFWSKVIKGATSDVCWEWRGGHFSAGYAALWFKGKQLYAHRVSFAIARGGKLALGLLSLDHLCRNRGCVNPAHLELVTHQENVRRGVVSRKGERS